jgi:fucose permease
LQKCADHHLPDAEIEDTLSSLVHERIAPIRDKRTYLSYVQMGLFGWFLYTLGPSLALMRDETGMSRTASSLYTITASIGGIIAGLLVATIVKRVGRGWLLRGGSLFLALGITLFISGGPLAVTVLGPFFSAAAGAGCVVGVSAFLSAQQKHAADASITEGNTVAAMFGIMGPLALGAAATWLGGWRISLSLLVISLLILEIVRGRSLQPYRIDDIPRVAADGVTRRLPTLTWWAMLVVIFTSGVEMSYIFWSTDLLATRGGLETAAAAAGLAAVLLGVLVGRASGSWLVERLNTERVMFGALVILGLGFIVSWAVPNPVVILIGLFIVGTGLSVQFPLGMSRAMRASAGQADKTGGYASAGVGMAGVGIPFLLAVLADAFGVHQAFLVVPVLLLIAMVLLKFRPVPAAVAFE